MRLLLLEDDALLGDGLAKLLHGEGYTVEWLKDGQTGGVAIAAADYDAVVLDLGLPRRSGLDLLQQLRAKGNHVPVLIITARDEVPDRVRGLDAGADDYLVKPFDADELCARLRAITRRSSGHSGPVLQCGDLVLDPSTRCVTKAGRPVDLSRREYALLYALMQNAGRVLSRDRLEEALYGWGEEVGSNVLEVHVCNLRRKLGVKLIRTVRGVGYTVGASN